MLKEEIFWKINPLQPTILLFFLLFDQDLGPRRKKKPKSCSHQKELKKY